MSTLENVRKAIRNQKSTISSWDLRQEAEEFDMPVVQLVELILEEPQADLGPALKKLIAQADQEYYNTADPFLLDVDYDFLRDVLNKLSPEFRSKVGAPPKIDIWPKVKLEIPMGSLLKVNTFEEVEDWMDKYTLKKEIAYSHKLDGSSIELTYEDGRFVRGVTRGSGDIGDDITPNLMKMKFPKKIPAGAGADLLKGTVKVRGEVVLPIKVWERYFSDYRNPRNSAAGTMRRLDGDRCEHLVVYPFWMLAGVPLKTKSAMWKTLQKIGFEMPKVGVCKPQEIEKILRDAEMERDHLPYEIDGIVIEDNDVTFQDAQGMVDNRPRAARAYKFKPQTGITKLLGVEWTVGRTGIITPTALVSPVDIGGVTISRVNLFNIDEMERLGVYIGCQVVVTRCNDVIPRISNVQK